MPTWRRATVGRSRASVQTGVDSGFRERCLMRLARLLPVWFVLLITTIALAQHSPAPPATHTSVPPPHVPSTPASVSSVGISSSHITRTASAAGSVRNQPSVSNRSALNTSHAPGKDVPVSSARGGSAEPQKVHRFLFFRRPKPEPIRNPAPTPVATTARSTVLPGTPTPHFGCTIAAVPLNSGLPCGPLNPCCP